MITDHEYTVRLLLLIAFACCFAIALQEWLLSRARRKEAERQKRQRGNSIVDGWLDPDYYALTAMLLEEMGEDSCS